MTIRLHSDLSGTISENSRVAATTRRGGTDRGGDDDVLERGFRVDFGGDGGDGDDSHVRIMELFSPRTEASIEAWKKRVDETVMTDDSARFGKYMRQLDELSAAITQLHREGRKRERRKGR